MIGGLINAVLCAANVWVYAAEGSPFNLAVAIFNGFCFVLCVAMDVTQ